jgi:hypothetical protein
VNHLSAFSWGYWGWGSHTSDLIKAADSVEQDRGRSPPLFVDIRFRRSVRAIGFRESAFAQTVGADRYATAALWRGFCTRLRPGSTFRSRS